MLYIIRHGKTEMNSAKLLQGRSNYPLNDEGIRQAEEAADRLKEIKFEYVFSSPLVRAIQTAQIVAPYAEPIIDERIIEMDYGPYEGADLKNLPPEVLYFFSDFIHNPAPEGMEALPEVVRRCGYLLEDIKGLDGNILISTHAIAMKGILEYLTPNSNGAYWSKYVGNCAVYVADNRDCEFGVPYELR